jgi:predicted homoserine dehydrogenase-like protein
VGQVASDEAPNEPPIRVGIIGTGFISRHFAMELQRRSGFRLGRVLTRRPLSRCEEYPCPEALTDSIAAVIDSSDVVFECSGSIHHASRQIGAALDAGKPVVTLNSEFHVTIGSAFVGRGLLSEAEGDQPGCQAALAQEARARGFEPLVFGNLKGFLNRTPTPEEMNYWSQRNGISLPMVTSFTDGTKLQMEQALVANGLGATIVQQELLGLATNDIKSGSMRLAEAAAACGQPISDYLLDLSLPHGVFVVGTHDPRQRDCLRYLKMGEGPYYTLVKPNILVHLEVFETIRRVVETGRPLLNNGRVPRIGVAAVAKRTLEVGERVAEGIGSFELRGICIRLSDRPGHLPIGLADALHVRRRIPAGEIVMLEDVDLEPNPALEMWQGIEARSLAAPESEIAAPLARCASGE